LKEVANQERTTSRCDKLFYYGDLNVGAILILIDDYHGIACRDAFANPLVCAEDFQRDVKGIRIVNVATV